MSVRNNFFLICTPYCNIYFLSQVRKLLPDTKITFALVAENELWK